MAIRKKNGKPATGGFTEISLVGQFFHAFENGRIDWQGRVIGNPAPSVYQIQLFEWLMGEPSIRLLVKIDDMLEWEFYGSQELMNDAWETQERRIEAAEKRKEIEARQV
jgi:hypothetical protein